MPSIWSPTSFLSTPQTVAYLKVTTEFIAALGVVNGPAGFFDYAASRNGCRIISCGPNAATYGTFNVTQLTSDATGGSRRNISVDSSGNILLAEIYSGYILHGLSSPLMTAAGGIMMRPKDVGGSSSIFIGHATGTASASTYSTYYYDNTIIGSISQSGTTAVLYNTTSDARLKEDIQDVGPVGDLIDAIQVRSYKWKGVEETVSHGFIAQELFEVVPQAVKVGGMYMQQVADEAGNISETEEIDPWAVDYSKLVPLLVKEIQDLRIRIAALEAGV